MDDQQQQQQTAPDGPAYPYFPITAEGLGKLHQEFGRMAHATFEQQHAIEALKTSGGRLLAAHGPDKCRPAEAPVGTEDADEPTPLKAASRTRGG